MRHATILGGLALITLLADGPSVAAARLKATASGMRHEWNAVRSRVEGKNRAEAEKFEALVARTERARTPKEYSPLASRVLDEVDHLESVFQR